MHIAVGIPQRKDGIAVVALFHPAGAVVLEERILPVHVVQYIGMDEGMVQRSIEHLPLFFGAAFHAYAREGVLPLFQGAEPHAVEIEPVLFGLEVHAGVFATHERYPHLHADALPFRDVETEPAADVVTAHLAEILRVHLVFSGIGVPGGFGLHGGLLLEETGLGRHFAEPQHEVLRDYGLGIRVAEPSAQAHALHLGIGNLPDEGAGFVGKGFAQIQQDIGPAAGKSIAFDARAERRGDLGLDAVFREHGGIIAGLRHLIFIQAAVFGVIHLQLPSRRHHQHRAHVGAAHTAEVHVAETGEIAVVGAVRGTPPAEILVPGVLRRAADIERAHAHHPVRQKGTGVGCAEIGSAHEGVYEAHEARQEAD